jgi:hypothetical protein
MSLISQMNFQNPWWVDKKSIYEDEQVKKALLCNPKFIPSPLQESVLLWDQGKLAKPRF